MYNACLSAGGKPGTVFAMAFSNFNFQSCLPKMNRTKMALAVGVLMVLAGASRAQTLVDLGASAPTPGASDVYQLSISGNQTFPDGLNYYTDNQTGHGAGEPGQTFTTGNNSAGYALTSVSIRSAGLGSYSGIGTPQPYYLHIYSVSGGNVTLLQTFTSANITFNDGDWLQWSGLSIPLAANTAYAWSFGTAGSTGSWEAMGVASGNPYVGGQIGLFPPAGGAITFGSGSFDAVFDVGLVPANVPSINQLTVSPTNNVFVGTLVTFTASVSGALPLHFQWQFNSGGGLTNVPGANTNTLVLTAAVTNTGSYQLVLTNSYGAVTSAPVSLTVTRDITPPTVLRVVNIGATNVEVDYSKLLETASATNVANYVLTNGTAITGASLATNGATVLLTTAPLVYGSNYTLVINSVRDQAIPPNTITTNTLVRFTASAFTPQDIGNPPVLSSVTIVSNGLTVTAAGSDIGGTADQFNFEYQTRAGDFDVSVRVAGLTPSDVWAKAGLMARETLDAGGRFAASMATPAMNGGFLEWRDPPAARAVRAGISRRIIRTPGCG